MIPIPQFSPKNSLAGVVAGLFQNNEPGVWYDPSDFSTMFQDAAGTTPVTAVEQPVGLILDKSKGLALGPELVTNPGPFINTTGWLTSSTTPLAVSGGILTGTTAAASDGLIYGAWLGNVNQIKYFQITTTITALAGRVRFKIYGSNVVGPWITEPGTYTIRLYQTIANGNVGLNTDQATTVSISSFSVRELLGNHAYQTTTTSRPVLSARYNLLTKTEQFDDAVWVKTNSTVTPNAIFAPNKTLTADAFLDVSGGTYAEIRQVSVNVASGVSYRYSIRAKKGTRRYVFISLSAPRFPTQTDAIFDLETATVKSSGAGASFATAVLDDEGFVVCSFTATASSTGSVDVFVYHTNDAGTSVFYTGTGAGSIYIWGASLVPANQAHLPYQRVNTATDYDTVGFKPYLIFDGIDDGLVTNTITPGTDKVQVFAGVRKLSDAAPGVLAELSADRNTNNGTFTLSALEPPPRYFFALKGTVERTMVVASGPAPETGVLSGFADIAAPTALMRINGVQVASSSLTLGTGNYLAYPLYIGRRGGTTLPFNGQLYSLIVRFGNNLPIETIEKTEEYVGIKTGVAL